jgi:hypothetical protein
MRMLPGFQSEYSVSPAMQAENPKPSTTGVSAGTPSPEWQNCMNHCYVTCAGCLVGALFNGGGPALGCTANLVACEFNCGSP